jgi:iron-sulfur cluster assembly protein
MSEQSVITLTEAAANRVKEIVTTAANNIAGVRIVVKEGGCAGYSYSMEYAAAKNPNDEVIVDKGVTIFVEPKAVMYLLGTKMDYKVDKFKSGFTFVNPNETERCGCGESFSV